MCDKCTARINDLGAEADPDWVDELQKKFDASQDRQMFISNPADLPVEVRIEYLVGLFRSGLELDGYQITTTLEFNDKTGEISFVIGVGNGDNPRRMLPIAVMTEAQFRENASAYLGAVSERNARRRLN